MNEIKNSDISSRTANPWRFTVAPMLDWTDCHFRYFLSLLSRHARLYTEMVTTGALLHGDAQRHLKFSTEEMPVALQLGGSDADALARCAEMGAAWGYQEINLNCGCPSDRVQGGGFGACLMREPKRVAAAVAAMKRSCALPVTVKCRIGVDDSEDYVFLVQFIEAIAAAGCETFIVHARKAWLQGLSPKENREIPPLRYEQVYRLKQDFPQLTIAINGGIRTLEQCQEHLRHVDGVMVGREAYENPYFLADIDHKLFGSDEPVPSRLQTAERLLPYLEHELRDGTPLHAMTRHLLGLFRGQPGGRAYRRVLSERSTKSGAGIEVFQLALEQVQAASLERAA